MAQARGNASTRAVDSLSDGNPKTLNENQKLVEQSDGSVWLYTTAKVGDRDRVTSRRVDSEGDQDHTSKGGKVWWKKLLEEQKAKEAKPASKKKAATPKDAS